MDRKEVFVAVPGTGLVVRLKLEFMLSIEMVSFFKIEFSFVIDCPLTIAVGEEVETPMELPGTAEMLSVEGGTIEEFASSSISLR